MSEYFDFGKAIQFNEIIHEGSPPFAGKTKVMEQNYYTMTYTNNQQKITKIELIKCDRLFYYAY